jgi:hypothetical protein
MSRPLAICLEDLRPRSPEERHLRCVAAVGRSPGLRIDGGGTVLWREESGTACELWVSADDRLVLYRPDGGGRVTVRRMSRTLDVPAERPVILLDQDEVDVGARRFRVHVHGAAPRVHAPEYLRPARPRGTVKVAAALAIGAALGAPGCKRDAPGTEGPEDIEVRAAPPQVPAPMDVREPEPDAIESDAATAPDAGAAGDPDVGIVPADVESEIEVRVAPPQVPAPMDVAIAPPPLDAGGDAASADAGGDAASDAEPVIDARDAARRARDASRPPPIEVRDMPPFVMEKK